MSTSNLSDLQIDDFVWSNKGNGFITEIENDKITIRVPDSNEERIVLKTDITNIAYKARDE